jgi:hypothetical protein
LTDDKKKKKSKQSNKPSEWIDAVDMLVATALQDEKP